MKVEHKKLKRRTVKLRDIPLGGTFSLKEDVNKLFMRVFQEPAKGIRYTDFDGQTWSHMPDDLPVVPRKARVVVED